MPHTSSDLRRRLALTLAFLLGGACTDHPLPVSLPEAPPDAGPPLPQVIACRADVVAATVSCSRPQEEPAPGLSLLILGGQDTLVTLTSSNVSYDGGTEVFQADVTVQNLIGQPLGTTDGTPLYPEGVRVFFHRGPVVVVGSGDVSVLNETGTATFIQTEQPYFQYDEVLDTDEISSPMTWQWDVPSTVATFEFDVYVSAAVQYPDGWVEITPSAAAVDAGDTYQLSAVVRDRIGRDTGGGVTWASSDSDIASVDPASGLVSGVGGGVVDVTATSGGSEAPGTIRLTVLTPGYDIEVRYLNTVPDIMQQALAVAVARWEWIIVGDVPEDTLYSAGRPVEIVDDLLLEVRLEQGACGGAAACAAPAVRRAVGLLPSRSLLTWDAAQFALDAIAKHQIGHALGFTWADFELHGLAAGNDVGDPVFTGSSAHSWFDAVGGDTYAGAPVPLENARPGSDLNHWRVSVFGGNELMAIDGPISGVTVGALEDLGYTVDHGAADPYVVPGSGFHITVQSSPGDGSGQVTSDIGGVNCFLSAGVPSGVCAAEVGSGWQVTVTATPGSGSVFVGWGGACTGSDDCVLNITGDHTLTADFRIPAVAVAVGAGGRHSCALTTDGSVYCWGENLRGELGDGTQTGSLTPVRVSTTLSFAQLAVGDRHTCALTAGGEAHCWGYDGYGRLGAGLPGDGYSSVPVPVAGDHTFSSLSVGLAVSCGIAGDGHTYCWGFNSAGQLGDGSTDPTTVPVAVSNSSSLGFQQVSTSWITTCALTAAGAVYCWGNGYNGAFGNGTDENETSSTPVSAAGGMSLATISVGNLYSCGLRSNAQAVCWGENNEFGEQGLGTLVGPTLSPTDVTGGLTFASLRAHKKNSVLAHTCGVTPAGDIYCWGANNDSQLGTPTGFACWFTSFGFFPCSSSPVKVDSDLAFQAVDPGREFTCALSTTGEVYCWGENDYGQLGDGTTTGRMELRRVLIY
jgi:alpha-tubulin suppressor-like RCC1 family protein